MIAWNARNIFSRPNASSTDLARFWFDFAKIVIRNHNDEYPLNDGQLREGTCEPRRRFKSCRARQGQRAHDGWVGGCAAARGGKLRRDLGRFLRPRARG